MFKYYSNNEQNLRNRKASEQLAARQNSVEVATSVAFVTLAENGTIDDVTATEHTDLFSTWAEQISYKAGDLRQYNEVLYRCVQAHNSQADWTPDVSASLWSKVGDPTEEYPEWSQPIGAHDAYALGDKVSYDGKKWVSIVDGNVWQPGIYGWEEEPVA